MQRVQTASSVRQAQFEERARTLKSELDQFLTEIDDALDSWGTKGSE